MEAIQRLLMGEGSASASKDKRLEGLDVPTVDVYDHNSVKRALDDAVANVSVHSAARGALGGTYGACADPP